MNINTCAIFFSRFCFASCAVYKRRRESRRCGVRYAFRLLKMYSLQHAISLLLLLKFAITRCICVPHTSIHRKCVTAVFNFLQIFSLPVKLLMDQLRHPQRVCCRFPFHPIKIYVYIHFKRHSLFCWNSDAYNRVDCVHICNRMRSALIGSSPGKEAHWKWH